MSEEIISVLDFKMIIDPKDSVVSTKLKKYHVYELKDINILKIEIKKDSNVIDVGAHIGYYTLLLSKLVGEKGRVFSFEPSSNNFSYLEKNIKLNNCKNVKAFHSAISDIIGEGDLQLHIKNSGDHRIYYTGEKRETEKVPITILDSIIDKNIKISFIKIDTQGTELSVLKGAENLIKRDYPLIQFEFWPLGMNAYGTPPESVLKYLNSLGYKLFYRNQKFNYTPNTDLSVNLLAKKYNMI